MATERISLESDVTRLRERKEYLEQMVRFLTEDLRERQSELNAIVRPRGALEDAEFELHLHDLRETYLSLPHPVFNGLPERERDYRILKVTRCYIFLRKFNPDSDSLGNDVSLHLLKRTPEWFFDSDGADIDVEATMKVWTAHHVRG